jgi:hypothetical protein
VKVFASIVLAASIALLISTISMAERWLLGQWEILSGRFFGTPLASIALAAFALWFFRREFASISKPDTAVAVGLALVVAIAIGSMVLLRDRYHGGYSALRDRVAPDGSKVVSVSWTKLDGRFIETINGRFKVELTEAQYREIMRKHQAPFLSGIIGFATIPASLSLVGLILVWRRR